MHDSPIRPVSDEHRHEPAAYELEECYPPVPDLPATFSKGDDVPAWLEFRNPADMSVTFMCDVRIERQDDGKLGVWPTDGGGHDGIILHITDDRPMKVHGRPPGVVIYVPAE